MSVFGERRVPKDNKTIWALHSHPGKSSVEILGVFGLQRKKRHAQSQGFGLDLLPLGRVNGVGRIPEDGDPRCRRDDLLEEFKPLADQIPVRVRQSRNNPSRLRQAGDHTGSDWIRMHRHDDWNRLAHFLRSLFRNSGNNATVCDNDIDLEADDLRRQLGEPFAPSSRKSFLDDDVLPRHISQLSQPLPESGQPRRVARSEAQREKSDAIHVPRRLRRGGMGRRQNGERQCEDRDLPAHGFPLPDFF